MTKEANRKKNLGNLFLEDVWGKRDAGIRMPSIDWSEGIRHEDVAFLLNRYPFLQIVSTDPNFGDEIQPVFIKAETGWIIHDYGDAMSASIGEQMYADPQAKTKAEDEEGGSGTAGTGSSDFSAGKGTVINQAVMTAQEMIALAAKKGWPGVEIIAGTPMMQWAAWVTAEDYKLSLDGFTPSKLDKAKRERVRKYLAEVTESYIPDFRP